MIVTQMATMIMTVLLASVHGMVINNAFSKACDTVRYDKVNLVLDCMKSRSKSKKMKCITNIRQAQLMCEETNRLYVIRGHAAEVHHRKATHSPIPDFGRLHNIYKLHSGDK